ncbi:trypsin-like serine peptidase [Streptomyces sp. NBC_00859]|uniref:trypsin-like serine peptidase n=1 Tax=Streptomyces sp. NBC_00859 TaxID=2903682 RepID=UPI003865BC78|nr:trypsin-like serine protease [Streptomyces sp. NBC_00859]
MPPKDRNRLATLTLAVAGAITLVGYASQAETSSAQLHAHRTHGRPGGLRAAGEQDWSQGAVGDGISYTPRRTRQNARVGVLFQKDDAGGHFCTASVVASPGRNMLVTAAHCAVGSNGAPKDDLVFAPGYRNGRKPAGRWKVRKVIVDKRWTKNEDQDLDVAFLLLDRNGGKQIQDVLGANALGVGRGFSNRVEVTGYPNNRDVPISCRNRTTRFSATQLRIHCTHFAGGTSGSPWVTGDPPDARPGTVIGVLGGYERGGDQDDVSYAAYFGTGVAGLYRHAEAQD